LMNPMGLDSILDPKGNLYIYLSYCTIGIDGRISTVSAGGASPVQVEDFDGLSHVAASFWFKSSPCNQKARLKKLDRSRNESTMICKESKFLSILCVGWAKPSVEWRSYKFVVGLGFWSCVVFPPQLKV
jgi:hypothetical protein